MPAIVRTPADTSAYALHEWSGDLEKGKYYFHLGPGERGKYLGQEDLATPVDWLDTQNGAGYLLTNEMLDLEEGEDPPEEDDPITYALGIRVMQDYGASWDARGQYFTDYDLASEALERLRFYETFPEWGKLAVIHGWSVPQRGEPCGVDEREEARIEGFKDQVNFSATLLDQMKIEHSEGTMSYRVIKGIEDQRTKKAGKLSRYKRAPVI